MHAVLVQCFRTKHGHLAVSYPLSFFENPKFRPPSIAQGSRTNQSGVHYVQAHLSLGVSCMTRFPEWHPPRCNARLPGPHLSFCGNPPVPGRTRCKAHGGLSTGAKTETGMERQTAALVAGRKRWAERMKAEGKPFPNGRMGCKNRSPEERELCATIKELRAEVRATREHGSPDAVETAEEILRFYEDKLEAEFLTPKRLAAGHVAPRLGATVELDGMTVAHPARRGHTCRSPRVCTWGKDGFLCQCDPIGRARGPAARSAALAKAERQTRELS